MRRSSRSVALMLASALALASGEWLAGSAAPAQVDPIGGLIVIPGSGSDVSAMRVRTSAGCPAKADGFYATMKGPGFPPAGQIVTSNTRAGISHSFGFDAYFMLIPRDYAKRNRATLGGRYDITVSCIDSFTMQGYRDFTGSIDFTSATHYEALGAAKPIGPPPPAHALAGDGSARADQAASPPVGAPSPSGTAGKPAQDPQKPVTSAAPQPASGSEPSSVAENSQRNDTIGQGFPWRALVGPVLVLVFLAGVMITVVSRARKQRSH
ncbi:MAG TPA: hypothetical protein VFW21_09845 [Mycobacterium sp.]|nr:hypothetical protein [Mycobacterium sp.]